MPVDAITKMVAFSKTFVDACHHGKEESCLFPCLEKKGIPREGGPQRDGVTDSWPPVQARRRALWPLSGRARCL